MKVDWGTYNNGALGIEFPFDCLVEDFTEGDGRLTHDTYTEKILCMCNISPATAENAAFAESAQYVVTMPFDDYSPTIYIDDRITVTTPNEVIQGIVERVMPVSIFKKIAIYIKRSVWNTKPK